MPGDSSNLHLYIDKSILNSYIYGVSVKVAVLAMDVDI